MARLRAVRMPSSSSRTKSLSDTGPILPAGSKGVLCVPRGECDGVDRSSRDCKQTMTSSSPSTGQCGWTARTDPVRRSRNERRRIPMTGLSLLSRADQRVCVALSDDRMAQGLNDLRWHLPTLLAGGTNTLVIDVSGVARLSSTCVATLLWVKLSCQSRRVRVVLADPTERTLEVLTRTGLASVFEIESRES